MGLQHAVLRRSWDTYGSRIAPISLFFLALDHRSHGFVLLCVQRVLMDIASQALERILQASMAPGPDTI